MDTYHLFDEAAVAELARLRDIVECTTECDVEGQSEASWNALVRHPLLRLALAERRVRRWNAMTATIIPDLFPRALYTNESVTSRLIDYSVTVEPSPGQKQEVIRLLLSQPNDIRSMSPIMYGPLRLRPSTIAMETKAQRSDEEAKMQLAIWSKAWLNRMETLGLSGLRDCPPIPLLRVSSGNWFLDVAWEESGNTKGSFTGDKARGTSRRKTSKDDPEGDRDS